jgi:hypothetical protein
MAEEKIPDEKEKASAAARLFDVRRVIGLLFVVYGVIVTLLGLFDSDAEIAKAQNIRINIWMGLAMLVLGGLFLLWQRLNPTKAPTEEELAEQSDRPPSH